MYYRRRGNPALTIILTLIFIFLTIGVIGLANDNLGLRNENVALKKQAKQGFGNSEVAKLKDEIKTLELTNFKLMKERENLIKQLDETKYKDIKPDLEVKSTKKKVEPEEEKPEIVSKSNHNNYFFTATLVAILRILMVAA